MKYHIAYIFTKRDNLLPWLYNRPGMHVTEAAKEFYGAEREIQLFLLVRNGNDGHTYCRIKCPVNPLPVKGEFEIPSFVAIYDFLVHNGWRQKQVINTRMFES